MYWGSIACKTRTHSRIWHFASSTKGVSIFITIKRIQWNGKPESMQNLMFKSWYQSFKILWLCRNGIGTNICMSGNWTEMQSSLLLVLYFYAKNSPIKSSFLLTVSSIGNSVSFAASVSLHCGNVKDKICISNASFRKLRRHNFAVFAIAFAYTTLLHKDKL